MLRKRLSILVLLCMVLFKGAGVLAHCEVPCGIYDDEMRIKMILEDITTVEKAMNQIMELQKDPQKNANQLIRWVNTKEEHAGKIQTIVTQYFMTQRIKFDATDYDKKLASLHSMLVYAMKCKQSTDLNQVENLKKAVETFKGLYFTHTHKEEKH